MSAPHPCILICYSGETRFTSLYWRAKNPPVSARSCRSKGISHAGIHRKQNEDIVIPDLGITIKVVSIQNGKKSASASDGVLRETTELVRLAARKHM